jgi:hypothetical protein
MTPSDEIMAAVEAVVPFESMMALEVLAGGMSRESMAAMPRGGVAGRRDGKNDRDPDESNR